MLSWAPYFKRSRILNDLKMVAAMEDYEATFRLLEEASQYFNIKNVHFVVTMRQHEKIKELEKAKAFLADVQVRLMRSERAFVMQARRLCTCL